MGSLKTEEIAIYNQREEESWRCDNSTPRQLVLRQLALPGSMITFSFEPLQALGKDCLLVSVEYDNLVNLKVILIKNQLLGEQVVSFLEAVCENCRCRSPVTIC